MVRRHLLVYFLQRKQLKQFYSIYLGYKEQNCIINFLIMKQTNRVLLTTVVLNDCYEAMVVRRHLLVYSLLRKQLRQFYLMYLGKGSKHPSKEKSYTLSFHQSSSTTSLLPILLTKKNSIWLTLYYHIVQWSRQLFFSTFSSTQLFRQINGQVSCKVSYLTNKFSQVIYLVNFVLKIVCQLL